jgi:hypothetical protein
MDGVTDADRERDDVKERVGVTESDMVGEEDGDKVLPKPRTLTWHVIAVRMTTKLSLCMIIGERQRSGIGVGRAQEFEKDTYGFFRLLGNVSKGSQRMCYTSFWLVLLALPNCREILGAAG